MNRGGLFPLNDMTLIFFTSIEKNVRVILPRHMATPHAADSRKEFKELVIQKIMDSEEVQWNWTLISQCIILADDSTELLREHCGSQFVVSPS